MRKTEVRKNIATACFGIHLALPSCRHVSYSFPGDVFRPRPDAGELGRDRAWAWRCRSSISSGKRAERRSLPNIGPYRPHATCCRYGAPRFPAQILSQNPSGAWPTDRFRPVARHKAPGRYRAGLDAGIRADLSGWNRSKQSGAPTLTIHLYVYSYILSRTCEDWAHQGRAQAKIGPAIRRGPPIQFGT